MGSFDMEQKAGTDVLILKEAQKKNSQAEAAAGLKVSPWWRYFDKEFLAREKSDADKKAMEAEDKERWKAQGVREFLQRMEVWFNTKASNRVEKEDMSRLKTLASGQQ